VTLFLLIAVRPPRTAAQATPARPGYSFCANEGETCSFNGTMTVAYGAGSSFVYQTLTNGTPCDNSVFGDPDYGVVKACYIEPIFTSAPGVNPGNLNFGSINLGSSGTQQATLTNSGDSPVSILNISIAGAGISATGISSGQTLAPGGTATLEVTVAPSSSGAVSGSISIFSNAPNSPATLAISGTDAQTGISHHVALSWGTSPSDVIDYNIYRSQTSGGPYNLVFSQVTGTDYVDSNVQSGITYYYCVKAVDSSNTESVCSNEVVGTIP